jgi:hypothetical protein
VPPICVVNFTDNFAREELELRRRDLFVSVIGTRPVILADKVAAEVVRSFRLEGSLLKIHHSMPKDFLLLLPDAQDFQTLSAGSK